MAEREDAKCGTAASRRRTRHHRQCKAKRQKPLIRYLEIIGGWAWNDRPFGVANSRLHFAVRGRQAALHLAEASSPGRLPRHRRNLGRLATGSRGGRSRNIRGRSRQLSLKILNNFPIRSNSTRMTDFWRIGAACESPPGINSGIPLPAGYSLDLRERVVAAVGGGASRRGAAGVFKVSVSTAIRGYASRYAARNAA